MPRDKSNVNAVLHHGTKAEGTGAGSMDPSVPKSPEWTEVPIKTIPPMKASASVAADGKKNSEERREETFSVIPSYSYSERFQTGPKLAPVRLRSIDAKTLEIVQDECVSDVKKVESPPPVNVAGTANATAFGLGSYLDIPVGQDISSGTYFVLLDSSLALSIRHSISLKLILVVEHAVFTGMRLWWNGRYCEIDIFAQAFRAG